jgi:hypothetical protein
MLGVIQNNYDFAVSLIFNSVQSKQILASAVFLKSFYNLNFQVGARGDYMHDVLKEHTTNRTKRPGDDILMSPTMIVTSLVLTYNTTADFSDAVVDGACLCCCLWSAGNIFVFNFYFLTMLQSQTYQKDLQLLDGMLT